jgi:hypothetical protein
MPVDRLSATFARSPTEAPRDPRPARHGRGVVRSWPPVRDQRPAVTKHLKVLQRAGLITRSRHAQWRPCRLRARPLREVSKWVEHYRRFWEARIDRLEDYLRELQEKERAGSRRRK